MILEAIFEDGTFILGKRGLKERLDECWGTHHLRVISASNPNIINKEVAIPIIKPKFWVIHKSAEAL
jgi:hypothetical protein